MELTTTAATVTETRRGQEHLLTVVERTLALPPDQAATVAAWTEVGSHDARFRFHGPRR